MTGRRRVLAVASVLATVLGGSTGCTGRPAPSSSASVASPSRTQVPPGGFHLGTDQAAEVAATVEFLNAYNADDLESALAALAPNPDYSDCDYPSRQAVDTQGRLLVARRLKQRLADHTRIVWSEIWSEDPTSNAVGVTVLRVKSDSLARLGFANGVTPPAAAKVIFTKDHRIARFALGPVGGSPDACRPRR